MSKAREFELLGYSVDVSDAADGLVGGSIKLISTVPRPAGRGRDHRRFYWQQDNVESQSFVLVQPQGNNQQDLIQFGNNAYKVKRSRIQHKESHNRYQGISHE